MWEELAKKYEALLRCKDVSVIINHKYSKYTKIMVFKVIMNAHSRENE